MIALCAHLTGQQKFCPGILKESKTLEGKRKNVKEGRKTDEATTKGGGGAKIAKDETKQQSHEREKEGGSQQWDRDEHRQTLCVSSCHL